MAVSRASLIDRRFGPLLPGRACGACTACCTVAAVEELNKPADQPCAHCRNDGCAIYEDRPLACRNFYCGWRRLKMLADDLRPDRSGVIVMLEEDLTALNPFDRLCIVARWVVDVPMTGSKLAEHLLTIFRRGRIPTFFSPFGSAQKLLVHPEPVIYHHIVNGTVPTGKVAREVMRWRAALPRYVLP